MNHSASFGVILSRKWPVLILEHLLDMLELLRLEELAVSVRDPARLDMALDFEVSELLFDEFLLLFATCKRLTGQGDFRLQALSVKSSRQIFNNKILESDLPNGRRQGEAFFLRRQRRRTLLHHGLSS